MSILRPLLGTMTQGVIFSCAHAGQYEGTHVHGLVITARCDIAQDKFPILNYVPVVQLDDWLPRDGLNILLERLTADNSGAIDQLLRQCEIAPSVLNSQSPREVFDAVFDIPQPIGKIKQSRERFRSLVDAQEKLKEASAVPGSNTAEIYALGDKAATAMIKELVLNRLTGYYFLDDIYADGDRCGYVVLLREVKHLSREIALKVGRGFDSDEACGISNDWIGSLSFDIEKFAMPVGEVASPKIEHILQTFSMLFGRIGLEDLARDYVGEICLRRPALMGERA